LTTFQTAQPVTALRRLRMLTLWNLPRCEAGGSQAFAGARLRFWM
jgi:hypothetical protein